MIYRSDKVKMLSRIRELENYYLLCPCGQEILQISQIASTLEEKCSQAYKSVRRWYSFHNFTLRASFQDKIMKAIPLSVAEPLPTNIFQSAPFL